MNKKQIYRDVRKRYVHMWEVTDADIIVALEVENNILAGKNGYLQAENDNLKRMYDELMGKYKAVKKNDA